MSDPEIFSNLIKYIVEPIQRNLSKKLEDYCYYDVTDQTFLSTNNKDVDIIGHQLELKFEGNPPVFISWATIKGWTQYSLCVAEKSFCNDRVEIFVREHKNWTQLVGRKLIAFEVYGRAGNEMVKKEFNSRPPSEMRSPDEPHLLVLHFENDEILGVANFHSEDDFIPKHSVGDDVWIIFGRERIDEFVSAFDFDLLNKEKDQLRK
jgi:hypothetical protein